MTTGDYLPYFGQRWDAPVCDNRPSGQTPVGTPCHECQLAIKDGDQGVFLPSIGDEDTPVTSVPVHRECMLRSVMGCLNVARQRPCTCADRHLRTPEENHAEAVKIYDWFSDHWFTHHSRG